jgi:hypothetical protein
VADVRGFDYVFVDSRASAEQLAHLGGDDVAVTIVPV